MFFGSLIDLGHIRERSLHNLHLVHGQVHVGDLSPFKDKRHLDAVALLQELPRLFHLGLDVVLVRAKADANAFHLVFLRMRALFLKELLLAVLVLAVIHQTADRRVNIGRHLHQIRAGFLGQAERILNGFDAKLLLLAADEANRASPNLFVDA